MSYDCKHKAAAGSINWFVNMLKGKVGDDQKRTIAILASMLHDMRINNCTRCASLVECHDIDAALKAVSQKDELPSFVSEQGAVGPLLMRKEQAKRNRLIRPFGR